MLLKMTMKKTTRFSISLTICLLLLAPTTAAFASDSWRSEPKASDEAEVRSLVQRVFEQLRTGQYGELYETLPAASKSRISRERFSALLQRSNGTYKLERMEVGAVRVSGDIAAVDTVMYGSVERPIQAEGKIVAQQYLVREEGRWRVATGDRATVGRFLAANPGFAKRFPIRQPRVFIKRDGRWIDLTSALRAAAGRRKT
jgi:hypothetical protein